MHVVVDDLEVEATCFVIKVSVDYCWVLLVDGCKPGQALQALGGGGIKCGEVELAGKCLALISSGLKYSRHVFHALHLCLLCLQLLNSENSAGEYVLHSCTQCVRGGCGVHVKEWGG